MLKAAQKELTQEGKSIPGAVSSMCWYASYKEGLMRADMEPSMTTKFFVPFVLVPVT